MPDLRAVALGVGAWTGALLVLVAPGWPALAAVVQLVLGRSKPHSPPSITHTVRSR